MVTIVLIGSMMLTGCGGGGSSSPTSSVSPSPSASPLGAGKVTGLSYNTLTLSPGNYVSDPSGTTTGQAISLVILGHDFNTSDLYFARADSVDGTYTGPKTSITPERTGFDVSSFFIAKSLIPLPGEPDRQIRVVVLDKNSPVAVEGDPASMIITLKAAAKQ